MRSKSLCERLHQDRVPEGASISTTVPLSLGKVEGRGWSESCVGRDTVFPRPHIHHQHLDHPPPSTIPFSSSSTLIARRTRTSHQRINERCLLFPTGRYFFSSLDSKGGVVSRARGEIDRLASTFLSASLGVRRDRVLCSVFSLVHSY